MEAMLANPRVRTVVSLLLFIAALSLAFFVPGWTRVICVVMAAIILLGQSQFNTLSAALDMVRQALGLFERRVQEKFTLVDERLKNIEDRLRELSERLEHVQTLPNEVLRPVPVKSESRAWLWLAGLVLLTALTGGAAFRMMKQDIRNLESQLAANVKRVNAAEQLAKQTAANAETLDAALRHVAEVLEDSFFGSQAQRTGLKAAPASLAGDSSRPDQVMPEKGESLENLLPHAEEKPESGQVFDYISRGDVVIRGPQPETGVSTALLVREAAPAAGTER